MLTMTTMTMAMMLSDQAKRVYCRKANATQVTCLPHPAGTYLALDLPLAVLVAARHAHVAVGQRALRLEETVLKIGLRLIAQILRVSMCMRMH